MVISPVLLCISRYFKFGDPAANVGPVIVGNEWFARVRGPAKTRLTLFCFPYAGAGPAVFRGWAEAMAPDGVEVCAIRLPARDTRFREPPLRSVFDVAPQVAAAMHAVLDRPYALYGHSLGGIVAFETARELRRRGAPIPQRLLVSASHAPQLPWAHPPLRYLDQDVFLHEMQKRYGGIPNQVLEDEELLRLLLPGLRADVEMIENYRYSDEPPLEFPVTVYGGDRDRMVSRISLEGWREQTTAAFRLHIVPGDHFCLPAVQPRLLDDLDCAKGVSAISAL